MVSEGKYGSNKSSTNRSSANKASANKSSANQSSTNKSSANQSRTNKASTNKPSANKPSVKANGISKAKNRRPQLAKKAKSKMERMLSDDTSSPDLVRSVHLEYLSIMQKYYAEQYEKLSKQFYAKFGQQGQKAKTPQQKSTFEHFQAERNKLFQASQYKHLHQLIDRINDGRGRDELYALTNQHHQGMKKTLRNLESML